MGCFAMTKMFPPSRRWGHLSRTDHRDRSNAALQPLVPGYLEGLAPREPPDQVSDEM
jgi:hypothetical protein